MNKNINNTNYKKKSKILIHTKVIVRKYGWSQDIFEKLIDNNVKKTDLVFLFENNYKNLLHFSLDEINDIMEKEIKKINIINFPTNKRIKKILMLRLTILDQDKIFYKKTFNHLILPNNINLIKKTIYKSVDKMWYLAGDDSTDFNFYTKRLILAGIYVNALLTLFNKNIKDVELNIDRNLKKISKIPKFRQRFSFIKDNLPVFFRGFFN